MTSKEKDATSEEMNAIELLKSDHKAVKGLFKQFEETDTEEEKVALAEKICAELTVHAAMEEKDFYPAARKALTGEEGDDLINEAVVEHRSLKMLIAQIDGSSPKDQLFEANVTVLKEYVEHHVKEEEHELFPKLQRTKLDLDALGAKLAETKGELQKEAGQMKRRAERGTVQVPKLASAEAKSPEGSKAPRAKDAESNGGQSRAKSAHASR